MAALSSDNAATGFILFDSSLNPIWFNSAAIEILSYPETADPSRVKAFLAQKLHSAILNEKTADNGPVATEFMSGRRRYISRAFLLQSRGRGASSRAIGLLVERSNSGWNGVSHLAEEFKLTPRQRSAVELLMQGLTNKEIATRMNISPNTVKAHIRMMMMKMGVSTRSGLLGKIIAPNAPPNPFGYPHWEVSKQTTQPG